jgi:nucleoside-diphosphate-sugar epimerase
VYRWPIPPGADESAPVVDGDPDSPDGEDYAAAKRGGELAAAAAFGDRALLARAGLILGPYEIVGRMPWWLRRLDQGGDVLAPGPQDRPLQYIDCRDLAAWMLSAADRGLGGAYNAVSRPGQATMASLLGAARDATGSRASLVWVSPEVIKAAGIEPWTELPIWAPPDGELASLHDGNVSAAYAAGLACRPVEQTVADTWRWLQQEGYPPPGRLEHGLSPDKERRVLASLPS